MTTASRTQDKVAVSGEAGKPKAERSVVDDKLLAGIVKGDERSLAMLYDRHSATALALATRVCSSRTLAEDAVQEAFLSLWHRPGNFDPRCGSVRGFLMAVVHHKAVDAVRREMSLRRRDELAFDPKPFHEDDMTEAAWISIRRSRVRQALRQLPPAQYEALHLAYLQGLTYVEVATRLDIPLGTAKSRMRDGMIKLKALI